KRLHGGRLHCCGQNLLRSGHPQGADTHANRKSRLRKGHRGPPAKSGRRERGRPRYRRPLASAASRIKRGEKGKPTGRKSERRTSKEGQAQISPRPPPVVR